MTKGGAVGFRTLAFVLAFCVGCLAVLTLASSPRQSFAQSSALSGYAWSDTIGWISLSCTTGGPTGGNICSTSNYGISIDGSGNMSGYAWSDNIGWISAQPADVTGCPAGTCTPRVSGTAFLGWWKAMAADGNGWDGWISLSCTNTGTCGTASYGITNTSGVYSGYAWGSDVVGWIDFAYLTASASCELLPASQTVVYGGNANFTYTTSGASSGSVSPGGISLTPIDEGGFATTPTSATTYTATVIGSGGNGTCEADVSVNCGAGFCSATGPLGDDGYYHTIDVINGSCVALPQVQCDGPGEYAPPGSCTCGIHSITTGASGEGDLEARPQLVREGTSSSLFWEVEYADSCTVSGNGDSWTALSSAAASCTLVNGACQSSPINTSEIYTLNCTPLEGSSDPDFVQSVTIIPTPEFEER